MVGENLGRYEIVRALGAGAMGQVFAAYDETLEREVALKVLRSQFSEDFERRQRFEREAKAIAALDHPNIVTIYSVEEADGTHFITMQLVDGKTLDELIPEGGLPAGKFLDVALRLVEAVAAAHQKGIVHRDLKPTNVMVSDDGRLKVLDFGLAKLRNDGPDLSALADPATIGLTLDGQIIGTVAYMAPEQAEGREADHRSDIFSLGVLMYEMATGEAPFQGDTPISVMSSIIKDTPSLITELKPTMPSHLARIVRTCLAKDPFRRYQTAIDLRNALDDLKSELASGEFERSFIAEPSAADDYVAARRRTASKQPLAAAAVLGVVAIGAGYGLGRLTADGVAAGPGSGPADLSIATPLTSQAGLVASPSWSPDGTEIVYSSDEAGSMDLYHQDAEGRTQQITDHPGDETDPNWAPNDRFIAYTADFGTGGIQLIAPHGSQPVPLTEVGARPQWSHDSSRIVFDWRGDIFVIDALPNAVPRELVADTAGVPHPVWSHDDSQIYYWNRSDADVFVTTLDGGKGEALELVPTGQEVGGLAASVDGSFLVMSLGPYGGNKDLWRVALDDAGRPAGSPVPLTWPTTDDIDPALSPTEDRLVYVARRVVRHLWAYDFDPATARLGGQATKLTVAADSNYYPSVSADGQRLVWTAHRTSNQGQLYSMSFDDYVETKATTVFGRGVREIGGAFSPSGGELMLTSTADDSYELWRMPCTGGCVAISITDTEHPTRDVMPTWSADGRVVAFYSNRAGNWDIWEKAIDNGERPRRLTERESFEMYPSYSPTGDSIAFWTNRDDGGGDIWVMDDGGADERPMVVDPAQEGWAAWSVDQQWFFFVSDRSGSFNIWAQPAAGGVPFRVTDFDDLASGLPEAVIYTKFAVAPGKLILPVEDRSSGMWMLEGIGR